MNTYTDLTAFTFVALNNKETGNTKLIFEEVEMNIYDFYNFISLKWNCPVIGLPEDHSCQLCRQVIFMKILLYGF